MKSTSPIFDRPSRRWMQVSIRGIAFGILVFAFSFNWIAWPTTTFDRFTSLVDTKKYDAAMELVVNKGNKRLFVSSAGLEFDDNAPGGNGTELISIDVFKDSINAEPIRLVDLLVSQRRYRIKQIVVSGHVVDIEPSPFLIVVRQGSIYVGVE